LQLWHPDHLYSKAFGRTEVALFCQKFLIRYILFGHVESKETVDVLHM
jgi:hypothetical protein